jgi:hypothetical protein
MDAGSATGSQGFLESVSLLTPLTLPSPFALACKTGLTAVPASELL